MINEMIIKENGGYLAAAINLGDLFSEEMDGLTPTFDRIKIPAGGGISYEVPGDDPSNPDSVKEFKAVILYHHPIHSYYKDMPRWSRRSRTTAQRSTAWSGRKPLIVR